MGSVPLYDGKYKTAGKSNSQLDFYTTEFTCKLRTKNPIPQTFCPLFAAKCIIINTFS